MERLNEDEIITLNPIRPKRKKVFDQIRNQFKTHLFVSEQFASNFRGSEVMIRLDHTYTDLDYCIEIGKRKPTTLTSQEPNKKWVIAVYSGSEENTSRIAGAIADFRVNTYAIPDDTKDYFFGLREVAIASNVHYLDRVDMSYLDSILILAGDKSKIALVEKKFNKQIDEYRRNRRVRWCTIMGKRLHEEGSEHLFRALRFVYNLKIKYRYPFLIVKGLPTDVNAFKDVLGRIYLKPLPIFWRQISMNEKYFERFSKHLVMLNWRSRPFLLYPINPHHPSEVVIVSISEAHLDNLQHGIENIIDTFIDEEKRGRQRA